jgi:hypothetical protein
MVLENPHPTQRVKLLLYHRYCYFIEDAVEAENLDICWGKLSSLDTRL